MFVRRVFAPEFEQRQIACLLVQRIHALLIIVGAVNFDFGELAHRSSFLALERMNRSY
jgi:hypothetical protein